jgi:DeoR family fructose operon transcriptional repressor
MLPVERRERILKIVNEKRILSIEDLVSRFDVGEMTIRRDIKELEQNGLLERVRGGVRSINSIEDEPSLGVRQTKNLAEKMAIAVEAAKLVQDGDIVFLDAGSTVFEISRRLSAKKDLTIITNGIYTALEVSKNPSACVIMIGGVIRQVSLSTVGPLALDNLQKLSADKAFITCRGIMPREGIFDSNLMEIDVKRHMISSSTDVILVADHTKFDKRSLAELIDIDMIDTVVTDSTVSQDSIETLTSQGVRVITVDVG